VSQGYIRQCLYCGKPLTGKQRKFCSRRHKDEDAKNRRARERRAAKAVTPTERLLVWCAGMIHEYGNPRKIGWDQWRQNRMAVR
jgi:endogenous inhibitor of DNA gyrase (YacG/DUF329 family)